MNQISFDIIYKKKQDNDVFKLSNESEFHQLKLMICGKYKIYDVNKLYIYYKDNLITNQDNTLLKDIFKSKKAKIEISDKLILKKKENYKYYCKCKNGANFICDKCDDFLCELCYKKKKHISHTNKLIKISEYPSYLKTVLKDYATELDEKILNDEGYKFFQFWNIDLQNEINNINNCYEFIKNLVEDIKQIQIDYLINICDENKYLNLKKEIEKVIEEYANIIIDSDFENVVKQKKNLFENSREILIKYSELKQILLNYTKTIKEIQTFNQIVMKEIKDKFNLIKKKYNLCNINTFFYNTNIINTNITNINNNFNYNSNNNINNNNYITNLNSQREKSPKVVSSLNLSPNQISNTYFSPVNITNNLNLNNSNNNINLNIKNQNFNNSIIKEGKEKFLFKIKDERKILCFSILTQTFKEKVYSDKGNFKKEMSSESDISQLNLNNKLYMLSGKNFNKFYYYDLTQNSIFYINNTLFSHYYGVLIYCIKNDSIYLLGGNNQIKNEKLQLNNYNKNFEWEQIPSLNEERQEFASMYFNNYIYIFFGFSLKKGVNLSSIERMNIDLNDKFEIIYLNEQISLSSLSCAKYIEENGEINNENEILLLGGFDGNNYIDTSLVFNIEEMKIRDCDIVIPNINTHYQFLFQLESNFIEIEDAQIIFDMKNNIHLLTKNSYYLYSENQ